MPCCLGLFLIQSRSPSMQPSRSLIHLSHYSLITLAIAFYPQQTSQVRRYLWTSMCSAEGCVLPFPSHSIFSPPPHSIPSDESRPSSGLLRTPLQSPKLLEPASPVRPFMSPVEDEDEEPFLTTITNQHHEDDADTVFNSATVGKRGRSPFSDRRAHCCAQTDRATSTTSSSFRHCSSSDSALP